MSQKRATVMYLIRHLLQKRQRGWYIDVKDKWDSLTESFVNDKIIEMTENEFVHHQSTIINHVGSRTIKEAREWSDVTKKKKKEGNKAPLGDSRLPSTEWKWNSNFSFRFSLSLDSGQQNSNCHFRFSSFVFVRHWRTEFKLRRSFFISFFVTFVFYLKRKNVGTSCGYQKAWKPQMMFWRK